MNRRIFISILLFAAVILCVSMAAADWKSLTTGAGQVRTSFITVPAATSGVAVTGACAFHGIIITTDGANDITLNLYKNTAASGEKLIPSDGSTDAIVRGTTGLFTYSLGPAVWCEIGIYVQVSVAGGGTCSYQVLYDQ